jgi:SAM-dependent methyltransferase
LGKPYLDLGEQPLANNLIAPFDYVTAGPNELRYPLAVALCEACGLSQLTVVVDPNILYKGYRFRSGVSLTWLEHCKKLAEEAGTPGRVLDIACNDGACLSQFRALGWDVTGVDPCPCPPPDSDIPMIQALWPDLPVKPGTFDLVIAQNVLGHVDDVIGFLRGVREVLNSEGRLVVEVPSVASLIDNLAFDTIYHEHLSYWNGAGMQEAAQRTGLTIDRIEQFPDLHGGTVRYWLEVAPEGTDDYPPPLRIPDKPYKTFAAAVARNINLTAAILSGLHGQKFYAWGASAKGTVMMNAVRSRWAGVPMPSLVIDQTPEKQGFLTPGLHIPIVAPPDDLSDVQVIWILSWNWLGQISQQAEQRGFKGRYLVTSPKPKLI